MTAPADGVRERTSPLDDALILVVGARRSGTNWLQRIIATHPDVVTLPGETHFFSTVVASLEGSFQHASPASPTVGRLYAHREDLAAALRDFCDRLLGPYVRPGKRLLERTPDHVRHLDLVLELYPRTHIVHIERDALAAVGSLRDQWFGPDDLTDAATEWRHSVLAGRAALEQAQYGHTVRYEELAADPGGVVSRLFEAIGLSVDELILSAARAEADVRANRWLGVERRALGQDERIAILSIIGDLAASDPPAPAASRSTPATSRSGGRRRSRLFRLRPESRTSPGHWSRESIHWTQYAVDEFLEQVQPPTSGSDLDDIVAPSVTFTVVDGAGRTTFKGPEASPQLLALLSSDPVLGEPVVQGDRQGSDRQVTVVHRHAGGATRVWVLRWGNEGLAAADLHRFPPDHTQ